MLQAVNRPVRAFPPAVGIAVGNEHSLKGGLDCIAQRVVDDAIFEGRGAGST